MNKKILTKIRGDLSMTDHLILKIMIMMMIMIIIILIMIM